MDSKSIHHILSSPVSLDSYLDQVANQETSHAFLGRATQGCYLRQINLLVEYFKVKGRTPDSVRTLDWGCGKGHISYLLRDAGFNITSCDVEVDAEDSTFGQKTPIISQQDISVTPLNDPWKLPFENQEFDLVVSFGVLEHVPEDQKSLTEIRRVLSDNGVFFFSFLPYWLSWTQRLSHLQGNNYHPRLYSVSKVKTLAENSNFRVEKIWHGQLFPKNSIAHHNWIESLDRFLTTHTPLKFIATNLEGFLNAK